MLIETDAEETRGPVFSMFFRRRHSGLESDIVEFHAVVTDRNSLNEPQKSGRPVET